MLNLSLEIVTRLALGQFLPATLPSELLLRLALAVDEPIEQVKEALMPATHQVAEGAMCYTLAHSLASSPSAFRAAIIADPDISATNKGFWLGLLDAQGL
jgi:hypothetical protein